MFTWDDILHVFVTVGICKVGLLLLKVVKRYLCTKVYIWTMSTSKKKSCYECLKLVCHKEKKINVHDWIKEYFIQI